MKIAQIGSGLAAHLTTKTKTAVIAGTMALATFGANAQVVEPQPGEGGGTSAALGDIFIPIEFNSIASQVAVAGATMIGLLAVYQIGFRLVRKFISRAGRMV